MLLAEKRYFKLPQEHFTPSRGFKVAPVSLPLMLQSIAGGSQSSLCLLRKLENALQDVTYRFKYMEAFPEVDTWMQNCLMMSTEIFVR